MAAAIAKLDAENAARRHQKQPDLLNLNEIKYFESLKFQAMTNKPHLTNDEEPEILMCVNVDQMKALYGSVRGHCRKCQSPVWVSESGQKALRQSAKLQVYCMECAMQKIGEDNSGEKPTLKAVPGALEELRRYLAKVGDN